MKHLVLVLVLAVTMGCGSGSSSNDDRSGDDGEGGTDSGSDSDAGGDGSSGTGDSDSDMDSDVDGDTDGDGDTDDLFIACEEVPELSETAAPVALASNRFGLDLFSTIMDVNDSGNVLVSPLSLHLVLTMAMNGAAGDSAQQMGSVLRLDPENMEQINAGYGDLMTVLSNRDDLVKLALANSMWIDDEFSVHQKYIDLNATHYDALVRTLNFGAPDAPEIMNQWVSDHTEGRIKDIIPDPISVLVVLYLVNAVFLDAPWTFRFESEDTVSASFDGVNGTVQVDMMGLEGQFPYFETDDYQLVQLPYGKEVFSMSILLPHETSSVQELVAILTEEELADWHDRYDRVDVTLSMPRFQAEYDAVPEQDEQLKETLMEMGMVAPFKGGFPGISAEPLWISRVKHKTFMEVTEEGTEAAAVSVVEFPSVCEGCDSIPEADVYIDRPFLVLIRDNCSETILFVGMIGDPSFAAP